MVFGKTGQWPAEEWNWTTCTIYKTKFKMDERPKYKIGNHQNPRGQHSQQPLWPWLQQLLTRHVFGDKGNTSKNELLVPHQDKKAFALWRKQSTKLKGNLWNERRYLQIKYQIKG